MNKRLTFFIFLLIFLFGGCAKQSTQSLKSSHDETSPNTVLETSVETYPDNVIVRDVPGEIQFDWDEALKNIYIAGKKVAFPKTVADLGADYSLEGRPLDNKNGSVTDGLLYDGKKVGQVILNNCNERNYNKNSPVASISLSHFAHNSVQTLQGIYKFRIYDKVKKKDIITFFGKPTQETEGTLLYSLEDSEKFIRFSISEDGLFCIDIMIENPFID